MKIFVVNVIKFITLHMNPYLTNIKFSCNVFITDVSMASFAEANHIINIIHINVNIDKRKFGRTVLFA